MKKQYYTKDNVTPDPACALLPPMVLDGAYAETDDYSAKQRKWQSAPCVCRLPDGRLLCTFSGDNFGGDEEPNNYNIILCSCDEGLSWKPLTVIDHMDSVRMHEPILWVAPDGTLWHFWAQSYIWWDGRGGVWAMKASIGTTDGTITWGAPMRLCDGVMALPPCACRNGRILLPVSIWKRFPSRYHTAPKDRQNSNVFLFDGERAVYLGSACAADTTFDENGLAERPDGSLLMTMRCEKSIRTSVSRDGGKTWTEPGLLRPHTSSRSFLAAFPSGNLLLVTNDDDVQRSHMTAFLSGDGGVTWSCRLLLDERCAVSYPAGCITADGRVYVTHDYNRYRDELVLLSSFTEDDIRAGRLTDPASFLCRIVSKGENGRDLPKIFKDGVSG